MQEYLYHMIFDDDIIFDGSLGKKKLKEKTTLELRIRSYGRFINECLDFHREFHIKKDRVID